MVKRSGWTFRREVTVGTLLQLVVLAVMVLVGWIMQTMMKLKSDGTVNIKNALGTVGTVYLTIPAAKSGAGKVTLSIQNRTMEYEAVTQDEESIATGARVEVCDIVDVSTIEVKRENG